MASPSTQSPQRRSHPGTASGLQAELGVFDVAVAAQAIERVAQPDDLAGATPGS
ncbi:hypothetical protein ABT288_05795 [Streptomyces sp. NPDC001093]|uniref:hypothetical protein n=1 Tax=Streptomyces sp. NPDC001093 TaxID=3154376 RepID=UPI00332D6435